MSKLRLSAFICLLTLFSVTRLHSQSLSKDIIERSIELIAEINEDDEVDYTTLIDDLTAYLEQPLNINTARREDLRTLAFVSDIQIGAIVEHREEYGRFIAMEELQAVAGLSDDIISMLRYFTHVGSDIDALSISLKEALKNSEQELYIRTDRIVEDIKGTSPITDEELADSPNSRYLGSAQRLYMRYRFKYQNRISIGITGEKDAGEEFFRGSQKQGFDYYSAHAFISGYKSIEKLALGDYHAQMGQGLTMWSGLAFGKSADMFSIKRNARGITPYRSVDENNFLRGAALTMSRKDFQFTVFGSSKKRDANILTGDTLAPEQAGSFTSLQSSGFHRTPGEVIDKNSLREQVAGAEVKYIKGGLTVGMRGVMRRLGKDIDRDLQLYQQFNLNDNSSSVIGADYDYVSGNLNIFGEVARSDNGGMGMVHGAYLVLDPKLTIGMLYRNYQRDFQGVYSTAIAENSTVANEKGLFLGLIAKPNNTWKISAWMDRFSFPWLKFQVDAPSTGYEVLTQVNYRPTRKLEAYVRYRYRERPKNSTVDHVIDQVSLAEQHNYRINLRYSATKTIRLTSRIEATDYTREGSGTSRGVVVYQDLSFKPKDFPVSFNLRYALFDSETYDSRLYAYEQDVLYFYSIPAYSGRGSRYYAVARYKIKRNIDLWVKWSRWHYLDRDVISSGLTEIQGNVRSDIRLQMRFKF